MLSAISLWEGKEEIAVDFECEFNLHIYGEHLCLIQVYDGSSFFLVDVRSKRITENALKRFFTSGVRKIWFDCHSDLTLVYKNYNCLINNIVDIRVYALALGFNGNLLSLEEEELGIKPEINKKKNQTANWLRRPLDSSLIEYALLDVAFLIDLKTRLERRIIEEDREKEISFSMNKATRISKIEPGWKRIGNWRKYTKEQRVYLKNFYLAREGIAKRFNVPSSRVMKKEQLMQYALLKPLSKEKLMSAIKNEDPRFSRFIESYFLKALNESNKEIATLQEPERE